MTETTISTIVVAICAALPPTILALASLRQGKKNHEAAIVVQKQVATNDKKTDTLMAQSAEISTIAQKIEVNDKKTDALIEKTTEIHTLTNGNLHVVTRELATANEKIQGLERLMARLLGDEQARATEKAAAADPTAKAPA